MDEEHPDKLRELASWYREFAERAGNPMIWESRLHTAADLDAAAERIERNLAPAHGGQLSAPGRKPLFRS